MKTCPLCETSYPGRQATCPADGAMLIESRSLEPGSVIRGKYRIQSVLGIRIMTTVYLAEHIFLARPRALKVISANLAQDPAFLRCFRREAQAVIELRHPNIVEVLDLDQAEDGTPYIAMEYVEGQDLRHALNSPQERHPERSAAESKDPHFGLLAVPRALAIARGVAQGLAAAHAKGIIHRDVKPENILLSIAIGAPETPKLLNFGIAAMRETAAAISGNRGLKITPQYAAPELWRGMPSEDLDPRTDLYALGGVLYEMLTGRCAFNAQNAESWMFQHLHTDPEPPSQLRQELANWEGLDALLLRLLAKDREQRPKDAAELIGLLDAVLCIDPNVSRLRTQEKTGVDSKNAARTRSLRPPVLVWVAAIVVALAAVFAGLRIFGPELQSNSSQHTPSTPQRTESRSPSVVPASAGLNLNDKRISSIVAQPPSFDTIATDPAASSTHAAMNPEIAQIEKRAEALDNQQRYAEAKTLYQQACSSGNGVACMNIGVMYEDGNGVGKDFLRAAGFYSMACAQGSTDGCNLLGFMYETGAFGVEKDYSRAMALYSRACSAGNANGCEGLGSVYSLGEGVPRDEKKAEMFDLQACNRGSVGSCVSVAEYYKNSGNISEAGRLYRKACSMGAKYACSMADELLGAPPAN
jgi:serine/threonine-protein kinase